jgi:hypothetical protein
MWTFTQKSQASTHESVPRVPLLGVWTSEVTQLEEALGRDETDVQVLVWDTKLGHFPFTNLDLLSNCILVDSNTKSIELDQIPNVSWMLCLCLASSLESWDLLLQQLFSRVSNSKLQGIRLFTTDRTTVQIEEESLDAFECVLISPLTLSGALKVCKIDLQRFENEVVFFLVDFVWLQGGSIFSVQTLI